MFLCAFVYFLINFLKVTQSFYIALSQINIRTRNKISAGVLIIREPRRKGAVGVRQAAAVLSIRAGTLEKIQFFFEKISQCRKLSHSSENCRTLPKMSHSLSSYIVEHTRLVPKTKAANQNRLLHHPSRQPREPFNYVSQSESSITSPKSSANQNRALRHSRALG